LVHGSTQAAFAKLLEHEHVLSTEIEVFVPQFDFELTILRKGKKAVMFSKWRSEKEDICPELPIKPQVAGNEIAVVACG
jgi:hypothetical protein